MKKVLLLGDSIRLNYQPVVFRTLSDVAEVYGPDDNCRFCRYTLWNLDEWLSNEKFDVIHINCGIWDITRKEQYSNECFTGIYEYTRDMTTVIRALKNTGAKVILATSTPVKEDSDFHKNSDIERYNEALCNIAQKEGILLNDLHKKVSENKNEYICEDNIHLSKQGIKVLGGLVSDVIRSNL